MSGSTGHDLKFRAKLPAVFFQTWMKITCHPVDIVWSKTDFMLKNVQNAQCFSGMFIMAFTFSISSLLRCSRINPLQRKAHKRSESIACVYGSQDLLYFILLTHTCTHTKTLTSARAVNEETGFGSALSYLQDVCCIWHLSWLRGPWTSCKRYRSIQCQGPGASCVSVITSLFTLR